MVYIFEWWGWFVRQSVRDRAGFPFPDFVHSPFYLYLSSPLGLALACGMAMGVCAHNHTDPSHCADTAGAFATADAEADTSSPRRH